MHHIATAICYAALVIVVLVNCANTDATDTNGGTPQHIAVHSGHAAVATVFSERGADFGAAIAQQRTTLHFDAVSQRTRVVALLLERGINIEAATV